MIIALTGLKGSGKSTVAEMIGGVCIGFADPLKQFCQKVFGFTDEELYGPSDARERPSARFKRPNGEPLTARYALQTLGTEWGRNCDPDVWAKAGVATAKDLAEDSGIYPVVITDLRFVNEARLVREAGGQVWRISRTYNVNPALDPHPSEAEIYSDAMGSYITHEVLNSTLAGLRIVIEAFKAEGFK